MRTRGGVGVMRGHVSGRAGSGRGRAGSQERGRGSSRAQSQSQERGRGRRSSQAGSQERGRGSSREQIGRGVYYYKKECKERYKFRISTNSEFPQITMGFIYYSGLPLPTRGHSSAVESDSWVPTHVIQKPALIGL